MAAYFGCFRPDDFWAIDKSFATEDLETCRSGCHRQRNGRRRRQDYLVFSPRTKSAYYCRNGRAKPCVVREEVTAFLSAYHARLHRLEDRLPLKRFRQAWREIPKRWHGVTGRQAEEVFQKCLICCCENRFATPLVPLPLRLQEWEEKLALGELENESEEIQKNHRNTDNHDPSSELDQLRIEVEDCLEELRSTSDKSDTQPRWSLQLQRALAVLTASEHARLVQWPISDLAKAGPRDGILCTAKQLYDHLGAISAFGLPVVVRSEYQPTQEILPSFLRLVQTYKQVTVQGHKHSPVETCSGDKAYSLFTTASSSSRLTNESKTVNLLDCRDLVAIRQPDFLSNWEAQLLGYLCQSQDIGKQQVRYTDVEACGRFNICASKGSFSSWHADMLNGTWLRCLAGKKYWYVVSDLTPSERSDFSEKGPDWHPAAGRVRLIVLEAGDMLLMPAGSLIAHAVLTVQDCLMDGGSYWNIYDLPEVLQNMLWIAQNPETTNESLPLQLPAVLSLLKTMCEKQSWPVVQPPPPPTVDFWQLRKQAAIDCEESLKKLAHCKHRGPCSADVCPCLQSLAFGYRCTTWCHVNGQCPQRSHGEAKGPSKKRKRVTS